MIKVYVDWNVMSQMKAGNLKQLEAILNNRQKFMNFYSTSHISDILVSVKEDETQRILVQSDLEYITKLTDNLCLYNDSKNICYSFRNPGELLEDRIEEKFIFQDFSVDTILEVMKGDGDEYDQELNPLVELFESLVKSLDDIYRIQAENTVETPESIEFKDKIFPGWREDPTFSGLMKNFGKMYNNMNETESYKDLREMVQKIGLSSGHFSPGKNPFTLIENAYSKSGVNPDEYIQKSKNAPEWFDAISNEYIKLDIHGYKADKIKVTAKEKNTFRNTIDDSFHSGFASLCDFYITNDSKNYDKTKAVYEKLEIYTKVLKPDEFIEYFNEFLNLHTFDQHYNSVVNHIKFGSDFYPFTDDAGNRAGFIAYTNQFFFNFFNKLTVCFEDADKFFLISKEYSADAKIVPFKEVECLVEFFLEHLGIDADGKSKLEISELENRLNWEGRRWNTSVGEVKLKQRDGWFQLYFYLNPN